MSVKKRQFKSENGSPIQDGSGDGFADRYEIHRGTEIVKSVAKTLVSDLANPPYLSTVMEGGPKEMPSSELSGGIPDSVSIAGSENRDSGLNKRQDDSDCRGPNFDTSEYEKEREPSVGHCNFTETLKSHVYGEQEAGSTSFNKYNSPDDDEKQAAAGTPTIREKLEEMCD